MAARTMTTVRRSITKESGRTLAPVERYEAVKRAILAIVPKDKEGIAFRD